MQQYKMTLTIAEKVLANGAFLLATWRSPNEGRTHLWVVLAKRVDRDINDPYVVWDYNADTESLFSGGYFTDYPDAVETFLSDVMKDLKHIPTLACQNCMGAPSVSYCEGCTGGIEMVVNDAMQLSRITGTDEFNEVMEDELVGSIRSNAATIIDRQPK